MSFLPSLNSGSTGLLNEHNRNILQLGTRTLALLFRSGDQQIGLLDTVISYSLSHDLHQGGSTISHPPQSLLTA
jgi:hypothetical protein